MNVFELRQRLIQDYGSYVRSFIHIREPSVREVVDSALEHGLLWPDPLIQLNPAFERGAWIEDLVREGVLHEECGRIFRLGKSAKDPGRPLALHRHQAEAIGIARTGASYVLTTGTGSGKSLAYIIPIVDHVLRSGGEPRIQAIVVYPMNALANSQMGELQRFLSQGYPDLRGPVSFARYTGQESDDEKQAIIQNPPHILLTNYVMLELLLTRPGEGPLVQAARNLRFLVLDELHTYRGRQGADVALLVRRAREAFSATSLQCVGTSATLAAKGTLEEQRREVAHVASILFGTPVAPEHVVGETLRRATPEQDPEAPELVGALREGISRAGPPPSTHAEFVADPLSIWIESTFGLRSEPRTGRLLRAPPRSITGRGGAAAELSRVTGISEERCAAAIQSQLLASYSSALDPETGFPLFAFRLHQVVGRGETVYATLEPGGRRYLTVQRQQFVPGDRRRVLLPLVFCRECGQEYYCVRWRGDPKTGPRVFESRELSDQSNEEGSEAGFLYLGSDDPWPEDTQAVRERLPEDWIEEGAQGPRIRRDRRRFLPNLLRVDPSATESDAGLECHSIPAPFRFCLRCGVAYGFRQQSDFGKLATLGTEGRSSATTILSLAAIRYLRGEANLARRAQKLLSFTDNRQDASLQAGHFNDFIEVGLLRSALCRAVAEAGEEGLRHDVLVQRVFEALDLPLELYAADPGVKFAALEDTQRAFRSVLGYRLYRDLQRGWRVTSPNLEQCDLLRIEYLSLEELCRDDAEWSSFHPALAGASAQTRVAVAKALLHLLRRELAIKVDYLQPVKQEQIQQQSAQRLRDPWAIDENERMEHASVLRPRSRRKGDYPGALFVSPRSGFGQYLRRPNTFPAHPDRLGLEDTGRICSDLLEALRVAGIVEKVREPASEEDVPGYQLVASAILWQAGDGTRPFHDPVRVPRVSDTGGRANPFFLDFYRALAAEGKGLEAREHTAQVEAPERQKREEDFREGRLPILYCSPTMELGVDIQELNAVSLRNMPPTPANYAQRSGRAGRSGQPAIVFAYCSNRSSHDHYFFRLPEQMVAGAVTPPRLDLANEDLIRAHVHAVWLAETGLSLGSSLKDVVDVSDEQPVLPLHPHVRDAIEDGNARARARERAARILDGIREEIESAPWYSEQWLEETLTQIGLRFDHACERWRDLYRAAKRQQALQHAVITDASRSVEEKRKARRLRAEAESQLDLLLETRNVVQADFYSYRYFASEGFLPGYNFPRLPLSAYIPGRRQRRGRDEFLSRPRFLAISEFGPRAIIYHEGARFRVNRVILSSQRGGGERRHRHDQRQALHALRLPAPAPAGRRGPGPVRALPGGPGRSDRLVAAPAERLDAPPGSHQLRRGGEAPLRVRAQDRCPLRASRRAGRRPERPGGSRGGGPGQAHLRARSHALADQLRVAPACSQGGDRLRPRHRARLLDAEPAGSRGCR